MSQRRRYVVVGNPTTNRVQSYLAEFDAFWQHLGQNAELEVLPWADLILARGKLSFPIFDSPAIVRLESFGRDRQVEDLLLYYDCGSDVFPTYQRGLLRSPMIVHQHFVQILEQLETEFATRPHLRPTAAPSAIRTMFDKAATARLLRDAGLPVPDWQPLTLDQPCPWPTTYAKLTHGSAAVGMVAMHCQRGVTRGTTTVLHRDGSFWNTRQLQQIDAHELQVVLKFLHNNGAIAQEGIVPFQVDGLNTDLRVICVSGEPIATIFRQSSGPMTNLHLGGRRVDTDTCRRLLPKRLWLDALDSCAAAASLFDATMVGIDLVFDRGMTRHYLLEVNAFGDFVPGWTTQPNGWPIRWHELAATQNWIQSYRG